MWQLPRSIAQVGSIPSVPLMGAGADSPSGIRRRKAARVVRELAPKAHIAAVYAKPMGKPLVDTFITEVSQDTWIFFPWDTGLSFQPPIRDGAA